MKGFVSNRYSPMITGMAGFNDTRFFCCNFFQVSLECYIDGAIGDDGQDGGVMMVLSNLPQPRFNNSNEISTLLKTNNRRT
jgi:hypothetical protein